MVSDLSRVRERLTSRFDYEVSLDCPLINGSRVNYKWFRNGADITHSSDLISGFLNYRATVEDSTFGIYQCFVSNNLGSDYSITRILNRGKCDANNTSI